MRMSGLVLLLALCACAHHPRAAQAPAADTAGWRTEPLRAPGNVPPGTSAVLARVDVTPAAGFDRVAFDFAGRVPGYRVAFQAAPATRCGSGDPVQLPGQGLLLISFDNAAAHDEQGHATIAQRDRRPDLAAVRALTLVCDFEGEVSWALALPRATRFRMAQPAGSARLLLDVEHPH